MTTTNWESYLPEVNPEVPACPHPIMVNAVRNAAIEFCEKTLIWREDLDAITILTDKRGYDLDPPTDTVIVVPIYVAVDGEIIRPASVDQLDDVSLYQRVLKTSRTYDMISASRLQLGWEPDADLTSGLEVRAALRPSSSADGADTTIYEEWHEDIAAGAKARLMMMPNKNWTNPQLAMYYQNMFDAGIGEAKAVIGKGRTRVSQQVQMRPFA